MHFVKHFRHFLYGRRFVIRTDDSSLQWLLRFKTPEGQLARWLEVLSSYDMTIKHRPGTQHRNADALSRIPCKQCGFREDWNSPTGQIKVVKVEAEKNFGSEDLESDIKKLQESDEDLQVISSWLKTDSTPPYHKIGKYSYVVKSVWSPWDNLKVIDGVLYQVQSDNDQLQVLVPMKERRHILHFAHDTKTAAHLGIKKTLSRIREPFY